MAELPSSAVPALRGLAVEAVEWLPSGAESGLVRVRGRWTDPAVREAGLPALALRAGSEEHRFDSLPDARFSRDPDSWRGTYLVPAQLVATDPDALWLHWPSGARAGLPPLSRGIEPPPVTAAPEPAPEPDTGGEVIDRAVLAERRARRAEAAEEAQARRAAEALKAVEVLELRSAELERRLAAPAPEDVGGREALAAAIASAAALRSHAREWQLRLRTSEVARSSDAVRLAVIEAEHATGTTATRAALHGRTAELAAARREAEARAGELAAAAAAATTARAELAREREAAERRIAEARTEAAREREAAETRLAESRTAWDRRRGELEAARAEIERELARARDDAATAAAELIRARDEADGRASDLRRRTEGERAIHQEVRGELERALAESRGRAGGLGAALSTAESRLRTAETALATAEARLRVETVARTTLEDELDRARSEHAAAAGLRRDLEAALTAARAELESSRTEIAELRAARTAADEALSAERAAAEQARTEAREAGASLQERIAELESRAAATDRVEQLAREQSAAAAERAPSGASGQMVADLDAAAAALRDRAPAAATAAEPSAAEPSPPPAVESSAPPPVEPPPAAKPAGPRIVSPSRPPSRAHVIGRSRRDYPLLRGAVVKLAHDDPETAGRLLVALLPAQAAVLPGPLSYDLTIGAAGTFGVTVTGKRTFVERLERPRRRGQADFHLRGDPLVLAELLAGVDHRIGRFFGPVRARGRRRQLKALRALPAGTPSLADVARAGAKLDPGLVYTALAYAVHPTWTRGHRFTIAQTIAGDPPETWFLTARDGAGLAASASPPEATNATVTMTRAAFDRMLRGEPAPAGERPMVRGDREAVALMREWTLRAQGTANGGS